MSKEYILAIDHGTTSTRAIIFDHDAHIVAMSQREGSVEYPHPGWVEQDAIDIWLQTAAVLADVLNTAKIEPSQIKALGISNQRETTVLWDKVTGLPVYNAIVWQSRQTADICDEWIDNGWEKTVRERTGLRIDPYFSASKIAWILDNVEGARQKAEEGRLLFGTMDTWIVWKLTGGKEHISDVSNASRTMLCNIETLEWDSQLLRAFNIPKEILPRIVPSSGTLGYAASYHFFGHSVPICSMVGDQQAALFGQLCLEAGQAKNTYGTGGFLLINTGENIVRSKQGLLSTVAWQREGEKPVYALEGSIFVSGSLMKWMRDKLQIFEDVSATKNMAEDAQTTGGVYIVPAFVGLGAPHWDDRAKAAILGLTLGSDKNQLVRAALESMAFQVKDLLDAFESECDMEITSLKVDGGASANDFLLQFQADLNQAPVERFKVTELTALGAAFLAGLGASYWELDELSIEPEREFLPERPANEMASRYLDWTRAVLACRQFRPDCL